MKKLEEKFFYLYVFALSFPIFFLVYDGYKYPKRIASLGILFILFFLYLKMERFSIASGLILLYFFYAVSSLFWVKSFYNFLDWFYPYIYPLIVIYLLEKRFSEYKIKKFLIFCYLITLFYGVYGIFQKLNLDPFLTFPRHGRYMVIGFFGNPIYFSDFLLPFFIIFFTLILEKNLSIGTRLFYGINIVLTGTVILLTFSRTAWLAILVTIPIILLIRFRNRKTLLMIISIGLIISLILLLLSFPGFQKRFFSMFNIFHNTILTRLYVWFVSFEMIKGNPIFGVGAGNFIYRFPYYSGKFLVSPLGRGFVAYSGLAEKAHNEYLQILAELGLIGFVIFLGFLFFYFSKTIKAIRIKDRFWKYRLAFFGAIVAFLVDGIPGFFMRVPDTSGFFWIFVGLSLSLSRVNKKRYVNIILPKLLKIILLSFFFFYINFMFLNFFSRTFEVKAMKYFSHNELKLAKDYLQSSLKFLPINGKARFLLGKIYYLEKKYKEAISEFLSARRDYDFCELHYYLANAFFLKGDYFLADNELNKVGEYCINPKLNPRFWVDLYYERALCKQRLKEHKEAEMFYLKVIRMDPYFLQAYFNLGNLYYSLGEFEKSQKVFNEMIDIMLKNKIITEKEKEILRKISKLKNLKLDFKDIKF